MNKKKLPDDFVAGNFEDKYNATNPISRFLMDRFLNSFEELLVEIAKESNIRTICEVGCGEGELLKILHRHFPKATLTACDIAEGEINKAKKNTENLKVAYSVQDAEKLSYKKQEFDLVVCCEVLEHLQHPKKGMKELKRIAKYGVCSVPLEPLWRILNMARLKYLSDMGNTPGHLNHWSQSAFLSDLKSTGINVAIFKLPLPWQMYLLHLSN